MVFLLLDHLRRVVLPAVKVATFFTSAMLRVSESKRKLVFILLSESNIADG